jgi:hypothetical protein
VVDHFGELVEKQQVMEVARLLAQTELLMVLAVVVLLHKATLERVEVARLV